MVAQNQLNLSLKENNKTFSMYLLHDLHEQSPAYIDFCRLQVKIVNKSNKSFVTLIFDLNIAQNKFLPLEEARFILVSKMHTLTRFQELQQKALKKRYPTLLNEV